MFMCRKKHIHIIQIFFLQKNNQYYFIQIQTFTPQIQIQMCKSDSNSESLNKQITPKFNLYCLHPTCLSLMSMTHGLLILQPTHPS
jgi:hypothetical protein